jgi:VIT1/CCC1 family predicted Fe2+/Mn2+ transporter
MSNRLKDARRGFEKNDIEVSRRAHDPERIREAEEKHKHGGEYLGDFVFGAIDGSVTTFAVVSGVAGASLSNTIVLILGFANLFADGLSMAIGNYMSVKADREFAERERKREEWEIEHFPEGEREEIKQLYRKKGLKGDHLENIVQAITSNKEVWIDTMMTGELGIVPESKNPLRAAFTTFTAFIIIGFVPLISYVLTYFAPGFATIEYPLSLVLTGMAFFFIGSAKVYLTGKKWWKSGFETLLMGAAAAAVAYLVGYLLKGIA